MKKNNNLLNLDSSFSFLIYCLDRELTAHYRPFLEKLKLTYPQYLVMLVLWEEDKLTIGEVCKRLKLDTGTISPLLRRLEQLGYVERVRSKIDERSYNAILTNLGKQLYNEALDIPEGLLECLKLNKNEYQQVREWLSQFLDKIMLVHKPKKPQKVKG